MALISPCPRYNARGLNCPQIPEGEEQDWTQIKPIGKAGQAYNPLCKHTIPTMTPSAVWTPGQTIKVQFQGLASHSGGHGEFSISYDNATTFVVVHQELKYMFVDGPSHLSNKPTRMEYSITLPESLPGANHAVFAWTWVNASGNREFYMNCADVKISGKPGSFTGRRMTVANYGPDTPVIPEFYGDYNTGINYYINSHNVTVIGYGSDEFEDLAYVASNGEGSKGNSNSDDIYNDENFHRTSIMHPDSYKR
ncbi:hypothetical protein GGI19_004867 [Coemansia pectinata]|uniref:Chitin-binding type-4 domain-containing protein n=1 Tax=Coemansia pectinata TaxID=1052879 RepID=A0A9W8GV82_9FUNG|nr:hypothetical protein GGI19_004867 [Coemansia pectinata]